jgi:preprotein translocase SecE subunit
MPFVQDEKPMASDIVATGAEEPEEPRRPAEPRAAAATPSGPSFFTIYKKGQGKWTRLGTVGAAAGLGVLTAVNLYQYLQVVKALSDRPNLLLGICVGFLAVYSLIVYWLVNKPTNVDFLIATDSEMKKVNWTTQGELFGSTRVVILFLFAVAIFLFLADQFFELFFWAIGVLKIEPWFIDDLRHVFHH